MKYKILLNIFLILFLLLLRTNFISAEGVECPDPPDCPDRLFTEYHCTDENCGGEILTRNCTRHRTHEQRSTDADGCPTWRCITTRYTCDESWSHIEIGHPWQKCRKTGTHSSPYDNTRVSRTIPYFSCHGPCLQTPQNPRYFNNPNLPTDPENPEPSEDSNNIFLPVKLDWDNIEGWRYGDIKKEHPWWYKIEITHLSRGIKENINKTKVDSEKLGISEYNPRKVHGPCFLHSNSVYNWRVRACCYNPEKEGCGDWSNWQFTTNNAPEIKAPDDPDWSGKELIPDQPLEVELKWCGNDNVVFQKKIGEEIIEEKPESFKLFFYLGNEPGEEEIIIRHPWIGEFPKIFPDLFDDPKPIFRNERYRFFTLPPFRYQGKEYNFYAWRVAACERFDGRGECTNFSKKWRFAIDKNIVLEIPRRVVPPDNIEISIGLPVRFEWTHILGAKSYILEIDGKQKIVPGATYLLDYPELQLNTIYQWRIKACRGFEGTECGEWSKTYNLKTTGQAPKLIAPKGADIIIPTDFQWEKVPGAKSYVFRIQGGEEDLSSSSPLANARVPKLDLTKTIEEPKISLGFPNLRQEKTYSWKVKTCARPHGRLCGDWSSPQTFTTFKLSAPINPFPENNKTIYTYQMPKTFFWDPVLGAKYYKIIINQIKQEIVADNSMFVNFHKPGTYQWQVQACLDKNCEEIGNPVIWYFTLLAKEAPAEHRAGLIPCGRRYDNPNTKWNETAPCQIKHLFILLYIVLNFVLWTIIPLILVILVVVTGAIFYFSLSTGTTETIPKVKALWKSAGIGFGLIFLGWNIISFILTLFNYQLGPWYYIPI